MLTNKNNAIPSFNILTLLTIALFVSISYRNPYILPFFEVYNSVISESSKSFLVLCGAVCAVGEIVLVVYPYHHSLPLR